MKNILWVVYRMDSHGKYAGGNAVCEQREWDAMEHSHPGHRKLIQEGIANEGEAERVARTALLVANMHETAEVDQANTVEAETEAGDSWSENAAPITEASSVGVAISAVLPTEPDDLLLSVHDKAE